MDIPPPAYRACGFGFAKRVAFTRAERLLPPPSTSVRRLRRSRRTWLELRGISTVVNAPADFNASRGAS
jgi:hypothetical protein